MDGQNSLMNIKFIACYPHHAKIKAIDGFSRNGDIMCLSQVTCENENNFKNV